MSDLCSRTGGVGGCLSTGADDVDVATWLRCESESETDEIISRVDDEVESRMKEFGGRMERVGGWVRQKAFRKAAAVLARERFRAVACAFAILPTMEDALFHHRFVFFQGHVSIEHP